MVRPLSRNRCSQSVDAIASGDTTRVAGTTRYGTARKLMEWTGASGDNMVLVSGQNWADGVAAAPLAGYWMGGCLLLTPRDALAWDVKKWMDDNGPITEPSYVIGGTGAVSDAVYDEWATYYWGGP